MFRNEHGVRDHSSTSFELLEFPKAHSKRIALSVKVTKVEKMNEMAYG